MRPSARGWRESMAPVPLADHATGMRKRSATRNKSAAAPPYLTLWPTRMTGRLAESSMSTAFVTPSGSAPQRQEMLALLFRFGSFLGGGFLEDVEGDIEHDRPRPPRHHGLPRLTDRERNHGAARGLKHAFAIGAHGRRKVRLIVAVEFLKRAAVELAGR